jgi:hypothetical protein
MLDTMKTKMKSTASTGRTMSLALALASLLVFGVACSRASKAVSPELDPAKQDVLQALWSDQGTQPAMSLDKLRSLPAGSSVAIEGRIGGVMRPFAAGYASVVLADDAVAFCNEIEGDGCKTPWDACCEDPDVLIRQRFVVQVLGPDGMPLPVGLKGWQSLKELDHLWIEGVLDAQSSKDNVLINVRAMGRKG